MLKLVLADDEEIILNGLKDIVDWAKLECVLTHCFTDGDQVLSMLENGEEADIILTDIRMENVSGLDIAQYVYTKRLKTRIVLLSGYQDFEYARQAIRYGVSEYLTKPCTLVQIEESIRRVSIAISESRQAANEPEITDTCEIQDKLLQLLCQYIDENCDQPLTLENVAKKLYVHPANITRILKRNYNVTFKEYQLKRRIIKANELLKDHTLKIYEIAERVGYKDIHHFYDQYKRQMGKTPSEYRNLHLAKIRKEAELNDKNLFS